MNSIQQAFRSGGFPATVAIIAANVLTFFTTASMGVRDPFLRLAFVPGQWPADFWSVVTWPLVGAGHPFSVVCACFWAWWVCGSLERSWGTRTFVIFLTATAALTALGTWGGAQLFGARYSALAGLLIGVAPPTVAWAAINRREVVNLYGMIPVPAPAIAIFVVVLVWYTVGPPLVGLTALLGCAAAYYYATQGRYAYSGYSAARKPRLRFDDEPRGRAPRTNPRDVEWLERPATLLSPVRWLKERRERERLRRLFEGSFDRDDPTK
jgi:membrane associated rhomboid family serine protease